MHKINSIKDIALAANVSVGTVDRVIHNREGVSEKTRKKILKIIQDSKFKINPVASSLASKKKYTIAALLPQAKGTEFWTFPKKGILNKIENLKTYGFCLEEFYFDKFSETSYTNALKSIINTAPSAIIIAPIFLKQTLELVPLIESKNIPYVFINVEINGVNNLSFIGQSSYQGGVLAGKMMLLHTVSQPSKHIGILEIRQNINNYNALEQRILGFSDHIKTNNSEALFYKLHLNTVDNYLSLEQQLSKYLSQNPQINALYVPSSEASIIANYLIKNNRTSTTLIGFDITPENAMHLKNGTINMLIGQHPLEQGNNSVAVLFEYLINQKKPSKKYYLPLQIVVKENIDYIEL